MEKMVIQGESKSYPVYIGDCLDVLQEVVATFTPKPTSLLMITDEIVFSLHGAQMKEIFPEVLVHMVPAGEQSKSMTSFANCHKTAIQYGLDRNSLIIAFGGGMIGDLAGFVTATYMRGIRYIQVPTTLLAHDSAVGGKVAINHHMAKNMIGAFFQPEAVVYHLSFLQTLPKVQWRSGLGEVLKHGLLSEGAFFQWLEKNIYGFEDLSGEKLLYLVREGIKVKREIVQQDERERNIRTFLNFGHTLGHALESELAYQGITHGEAVAIGMQFALFLSGEDSLLQRLTKLLGRFSFPRIPTSVSADNLLTRMKQDKKSYQGKIQMVLSKGIGKMEVVQLDDDYVLAMLERFVENG